MKTILLTFSAFLTVISMAQTEGEVKYTTKIDMHAQLPEGENTEMLKSMLPQYQEEKSTLLFTTEETLYKSGGTDESVEKQETDDDDNQVQIKIEMSSPEEKIYTDVENGLVVQQRDLMDKIFLIKDTIDPAEWKITGETKMVSGLSCQKATLESEENGVIEAWFTTQIPVSSGPAGLGGLPGLIVYVSMDEGNVTMTATQIIPREIEKGEIEAPKKGKVVTREKYLELEQKKMEQMKKQYGGDGDGNIIMITE